MSRRHDTALDGIVFMYAWVSAIAGLGLIVCFSFYKLNRKWAEQNELKLGETA